MINSMWRSSRTRERGNGDEAGEGWICFLFFINDLAPCRNMHREFIFKGEILNILREIAVMHFHLRLLRLKEVNGISSS